MYLYTQLYSFFRPGNNGCGCDFLALHFQALFRLFQQNKHHRSGGAPQGPVERMSGKNVDPKVPRNPWRPVRRRSRRRQQIQSTLFEVMYTGLDVGLDFSFETHQNNLGNIELSVEPNVSTKNSHYKKQIQGVDMWWCTLWLIFWSPVTKIVQRRG